MACFCALLKTLSCHAAPVSVNGKKEALQVSAVPFISVVNATEVYMREKNKHH